MKGNTFLPLTHPAICRTRSCYRGSRVPDDRSCQTRGLPSLPMGIRDEKDTTGVLSKKYSSKPLIFLIKKTDALFLFY